MPKHLSSIDGFTFTDHIHDDLKKAGFQISNIQESNLTGTKSSYIPLDTNSNQARLNLVVIENEELFREKKVLPKLHENEAFPEMKFNHPNTAQKIKGLLISPQFKETFENVQLFQPTQQDPLNLEFQIKKRSPIWAVIIECKSLEKIKAFPMEYEEILFQNQKALHLRLNPNMWDLILVQK